jgi:thiol-disulfide isomerase/thioredoxin
MEEDKKAKNKENLNEEEIQESQNDNDFLDKEVEEYEIENKKEEGEEDIKGKDKKTIQNLIAAVIILGGLFAGSLFVDVAQLIKGEGISLRKLQDVEVFTAGDKTWVANEDPIVEMLVVNDEKCEECQPEMVIEAIKKTALPTLVAREVDINSSEGQELLDKFSLKAIPAFIFKEEVKDSLFYEQAQEVLIEKDGLFALDNSLAGIPYGKYIILPDFESTSAILGNKDANLEIIIFGDFQCPYSKQFNDIFGKVYEKYKDKVKVSFYHYPLASIHPASLNASMASLCANDQGKFWEMADILFEEQDNWGEKGIDKSVFVPLAKNAQIDSAVFKDCLDSDKHKADVEADIKIADDFALGGTPSVFVGDRFFSGVATEEGLVEVIEEELKKLK